MVGTVLIVDPDTRRRASFRGAFNALGIEVLGTEDPTLAAGILADGAFDAVVFTVGARRLALQRLVSETKRQQPAARLIALVPEEQSEGRLGELGAGEGLSLPMQLGVDAIVSRIIEAVEAQAPPAEPPTQSLPPPLPGKRHEVAVKRYEAYEAIDSGHHFVSELTRGPGSYDPILLTRGSDASAADPEFRAGFVQAARASEGLAQVNLPVIREIGGDDDVPYLAVAVPPGRTLRQFLAQLNASGQRLPFAAAVFVVSELALGAATLHRGSKKGLVHGAIDPSAVWLGQDGRVLLLQAGLGRFLLDAERKRKAGSPFDQLYTAPEDLRGGRLGPPADVYLLGVLLYELISGHPPFYGMSGPELEQAIRETEPPDLAKAAGLPREFSALLSETLSKGPDGRSSDGGALQAALSPFLVAREGNGLLGRLFAKKSGGDATPRDELVDWLHRSATASPSP